MDIDCIRRLLQDGSVIQSEVVLGLNHVKVVWFVPSCYPDLTISALLHGFNHCMGMYRTLATHATRRHHGGTNSYAKQLRC